MPLGADVSLGFLRFAEGVTTTIASGVLVASQTQIIVNGEGSASDTLDTINIDTALIMPSGYTEMLVLKAAPGQTITIPDNTGNIQTNSGSSFSLTGDKLALLFRVDPADDWTLLNG